MSSNLLSWFSTNTRKVYNLGSINYKFFGANIFKYFCSEGKYRHSLWIWKLFCHGPFNKAIKFLTHTVLRSPQSLFLSIKVSLRNCWWKLFPIHSMPPYHIVSQVKIIDNIFSLHFITFFLDFLATPPVNASVNTFSPYIILEEPRAFSTPVDREFKFRHLLFTLKFCIAILLEGVCSKR